MPIHPPELRPLTIDWYSGIPVSGGKHIDGITWPPHCVRERAMPPITLLTLQGTELLAEAQVRRLKEARLQCATAERNPKVEVTRLLLTFSGFPGYNNHELWNWWIPDIETRSPEEIQQTQEKLTREYVEAALEWTRARLGGVSSVAHCALHHHERVPHAHLFLICVLPRQKGQPERRLMTMLAAQEPGSPPDPALALTPTGRKRQAYSLVKDAYFQLVAAPRGFLGGTFEQRLGQLEALLEDIQAQVAMATASGNQERAAAVTQEERRVQRELDRVVHALGGPRRNWWWLKQWEDATFGRGPETTATNVGGSTPPRGPHQKPDRPKAGDEANKQPPPAVAE